MCGLAGIVDLDGLDRAETESRLTMAQLRLRARGPDGDGRWRDERCAMVHTRLAIVDLSPKGTQPMVAGDRVIAFNGMVYNFRRLRAELADLGHRFESDTDTEVLLRGWQAWGERLLPRLDGMFAFALWSARAGELVLARDRFGKKPLVYRHDRRRLAFASETVALRLADGGIDEIDPAALRLYAALRYLPEPWSIWRGVHRLPPGHMARFDEDGLRVHRWYGPPEADRPPFETEAEAEAALRERFDAAVAARMVADVPVGAFLSGGIDSAITAASLARMGGDVRTFTVGIEGAADYYEERPAARAVADYLGTTHTEIPVGADETRDALEDVFAGLDEPFADSSALPSFLVARETRRHVTVALSGDGADEVFGGYRKYQGELWARLYGRVPARLRRGLVEPILAALPEGKANPLTERVRRARRFVRHAGEDFPERLAGWAGSLDEDELDALVRRGHEAPSVADLVRRALAEAPCDDRINAMLAVDIGLVLPGDMLVKVDRMSMANALEVRCPFLDHHVVECAAAMPGAFKLRRGEGKRILRRAFADRLPAEVFARPKKGFEVPLAQWLTGPLRDLTRRAIDPGRLADQGLFHPELPRRWFDDLAARRRDTSWQLWTVVAFQAWWERHGPGSEEVV